MVATLESCVLRFCCITSPICTVCFYLIYADSTLYKKLLRDKQSEAKRTLAEEQEPYSVRLTHHHRRVIVKMRGGAAR